MAASMPPDPELIQQLNREQLAAPQHSPWYRRLMADIITQMRGGASADQGARPGTNGPLDAYSSAGRGVRNVASRFIPGLKDGGYFGSHGEEVVMVGEDGPELVVGSGEVIPLQKMRGLQYGGRFGRRALEEELYPSVAPPPSMPPEFDLRPMEQPAVPAATPEADALMELLTPEGREQVVRTPDIPLWKRLVAGVPGAAAGLARSYGRTNARSPASFTNPLPLWDPDYPERVKDYEAMAKMQQERARMERQSNQDQNRAGLTQAQIEYYRAQKSRAERPETTRQPSPPNTEQAYLTRILANPESTPEQREQAQTRLNVLNAKTPPGSETVPEEEARAQLAKRDTESHKKSMKGGTSRTEPTYAQSRATKIDGLAQDFLSKSAGNAVEAKAAVDRSDISAADKLAVKSRINEYQRQGSLATGGKKGTDADSKINELAEKLGL